MSVSRISSPADRVSVGQQILCAIKSRDVQGRFVLTIRELLGTWAENAAAFTVGETVVGIVRSVEEYGTFIEIAPNLAGLAESCPDLHPRPARECLHQKYPPGQNEDQAGHRQPQPEPEPSV